MRNIAKLQYGENQYVEVELKQNNEYDGGLGGLDTILEISQKTFDHSIHTITSFLNVMADKIKQEFNDTRIGEVSITVGASLSAEGNLIIASSTSEVNLAVTVTFKGED